MRSTVITLLFAVPAMLAMSHQAWAQAAPAGPMAPNLRGVDIDQLDDQAKFTAQFRQRIVRQGRQVYLQHCASCHGADTKGLPARHAPGLTDRALLYASDNVDADAGQLFPSDIERTIRYGIRSAHPNSRNLASMPAFAARPGRHAGNYPTLNDGEIDDLVEYLSQLQGRRADTVRASRGMALFGNRGGCFDCHGGSGTGDGAIGAPDLTSRHYLYGSDRAAVRASIRDGRKGVMPGYEGLLGAGEIKAAAYYLHVTREAGKH